MGVAIMVEIVVWNRVEQCRAEQCRTPHWRPTPQQRRNGLTHFPNG